MKIHLDGLTKEQVCLDIGAHIGFHTVYMAHRCKWVHAFEPQLISYKRLLKNCELNNITNVTAYNVALYNKECKMMVEGKWKQSDINYNDRQACSLSLSENESGDIQAKTLDSYGFEKVSFVKVDSEGCDLKVLMGGIEIIKRNRPSIIFESNGKNERDRKEFFDLLDYGSKELAAANFLATPK